MSTVQTAPKGQDPLNNQIVINIGNRDVPTYLKDLHGAIADLKMLVFERRDLDLEESDTYSLHLLTDFQKRLVNG